MTVKNIIMNETEIKMCIKRLALEIVEQNCGVKDLCLVGIKTNGEFVAKRIQEEILKIEDAFVPFGTVDIGLYRDDLVSSYFVPEYYGNNIAFDITDKVVVLCDDVLYSGRTVRAGIEALINIGRPKKILLLVLVDRGHRELPIRADFIGKSVPTSSKEKVEVYMIPHDTKDSVEILEK